MIVTDLYISNRQWTAVVFLLAIATRLLLAFITYGPEHFYDAEAERIAKSIALKGSFSDPYAIPTGPTAHCGPFYPAILSIIYSVFGTGTAAAIARMGLVILTNSIACALLPAVATGLSLPMWAGVGAGFGAALYPMHRTAEMFNAWDEPYAALGLMPALALLMRWQALRERQPRGLAAYGALWGILLYLSAPLLSVLLGLCLMEVLLSPQDRSRKAMSWLVVCAIAGIVLFPWTARNRARLGGWIFARSNFGLELYLANADGGGLFGNHRTHPFRSKTEAERIRNLGEIAYNRERLKSAIQWIQTHPGEFAVLSLKRCARFWLGWWLSLETALAFTLITALAVLGAWFLWRDGHSVLRVFGVVWICYSLVYYVVLYTPRYRIAIWWTVLLTAAYGAGRLAAAVDPRIAKQLQWLSGGPVHSDADRFAGSLAEK